MLYEETIHTGFKTWLLKALNSAKSSKLKIPQSRVRTQDARRIILSTLAVLFINTL